MSAPRFGAMVYTKLIALYVEAWMSWMVFCVRSHWACNKSDASILECDILTTHTPIITIISLYRGTF